MVLFRLTFAILFFCLTVFTVPVFAQTESLHISTFHSDYGLKLLAEGNPQQAADQFIQALFLAPSNKIAQDNLIDLAKNEDFESKSIKMQIFRLIELADYVTFLKERRLKLEKENTENIQFLLGQTTEEDPVKQDVRRIENELRGKKILLIAQPEDIQREIGDRWSRLVKINKYFLAVKEALLSDFSAALSMFERLNTLKTQVVKSAAEKQRHQLRGRYENQITAIKRQLVHRDRSLKNQESQVRLLRKELAAVRSDFEYLHSNMKGTNAKMAELTKKMATMSLRAYERETVLADKNNRIAKLEGNLNDAQQRWELVQKIIQEKDGQIKDLEDRLSGLAGEIFATPLPGGEKMKSLQESLTVLQKKMEAQEALNHSTISSLHKDFALLQEQYILLEELSKEKDLEIGRLQNTVTIKSKKLTDVAEFFDVYDKDLFQLNGVLEIYRGKLSEAHGFLTQKDKKLQDLEKQVADLKEMINSGSNDPRALKNIGTSDAIKAKMASSRIRIDDLGDDHILEKTKNDLEQLLPDYLPIKSNESVGQ